MIILKNIGIDTDDFTNDDNKKNLKKNFNNESIKDENLTNNLKTTTKDQLLNQKVKKLLSTWMYMLLRGEL